MNNGKINEITDNTGHYGWGQKPEINLQMMIRYLESLEKKEIDLKGIPLRFRSQKYDAAEFLEAAKKDPSMKGFLH